MDSQTLMLIILIVILIFIYKVMSSVGTKMANQEKEEEYIAQKLLLKVFFDRGKRSAIADLGEFDKTGIIRIVMFVTEPPKNEIERQAEGKWADAGSAVVKIKKDTNEVVSWRYIK